MGDTPAVVDWVPSTATGRHVCCNKALFQSLDESVGDEDVYLPSYGGYVKSSGKGKVSLRLSTGKVFALSNVAYVPTLGRNLVSVGLIANAGHRIVFGDGKVVITNDQSGDLVGEGFVKAGAFVLDASADVRGLAIPI